MRSTGTTAVAPSGTAAPVEIAIAVPGRTAASAGCPARASPISSSSAAAPAINAYPSMAELSKGGTEIGLSTSSASTRPSASATGTGSAGSRPTASNTWLRASAMGIRSAIRGIFSVARERWITRQPRRFRE